MYTAPGIYNVSVVERIRCFNVPLATSRVDLYVFLGKADAQTFLNQRTHYTVLTLFQG